MSKRDLDFARPEKVGLSRDGLDRLGHALEREIAEDACPAPWR